jgi:PHD and RING finger domain-containing protein 1
MGMTALLILEVLRLHSDSESSSSSDNDGPLQTPSATAQVCPCEVAFPSTSGEAVPHADSSSDEDSEKCPICLDTFSTQEVGIPDTCNCTFCAYCLQQFSKNVNTCPIDQQVFNGILV